MGAKASTSSKNIIDGLILLAYDNIKKTCNSNFYIWQIINQYDLQSKDVILQIFFKTIEKDILLWSASDNNKYLTHYKQNLPTDIICQYVCYVCMFVVMQNFGLRIK